MRRRYSALLAIVAYDRVRANGREAKRLGQARVAEREQSRDEDSATRADISR